MRRAVLLLAGVLLAACHRETRDVRMQLKDAHRDVFPVRVNPLQPGPPLPARDGSDQKDIGNSYAISEGQRLFNWYNCSGCHAQGGGGMGPALMDSVWIYGSSPANIFDTIEKGRPNGMPSYGGHIPEAQVWQIVAYVKTLNPDRPIGEPPGPRRDAMQASEGRRSR